MKEVLEVCEGGREKVKKRGMGFNEWPLCLGDDSRIL
jgi:hypothetical protein